MLNIILYFLIGFSVVVIGLIVYRKIPILVNLTEEEISILSRKKSLIQRIKEINFKKYWFKFMVVLEKILRKLKIFSLKLDNLLNKWIKSLRNHSQVMAQKSREWIRQKEIRRRMSKDPLTNKRKDDKIAVENEEEPSQGLDISKESEQKQEEKEKQEDENNIPLEELQKPLEEEQKWINLIIENPKNITAYKFLGLLYWRQHNYSDAKKSLEMAAKLGSKDKKVKDVLKKLKKMGVK
jgi:hypothetical protein